GMCERDKDELRQPGIPIRTVTYSINYGLEQATGYRLTTKNFHLPYLRLMAESRGGTSGEEPAASAPRPGDRADASDAALNIAPDEASAALDGLSELSAVPSFPLREAARSAFRKLAFDLDPHILRESLPVVYAQDPETEATGEVLRLLSDAVQRRKTVRFRYRGMTRDTDDERQVHPFGL